MRFQQFPILAAIALLVGCSTPANELVWYNPSKSQHEADQDFYAAKYEAAKSRAISSTGPRTATSFATASVAGMKAEDAMSAYLQSKGYRLVKRSEIPAAVPAAVNNRDINSSFVTTGVQPFLYSLEGSYLEILSLQNNAKELQGVKTGDRVLEIDGVAVKGMSMIQVHRSLTGKVGEIKKLQVQSSDGTLSTVSMALVKEKP